MTGVKIHPRYFQVEQAKNILGMTMARLEKGRSLTIALMVETFLQIAIESNRTNDLGTRKLPKFEDNFGKQFVKALLEVEEEYELTAAETAMIMIELSTRIQVCAIQVERHPGDPEKGANEA